MATGPAFHAAIDVRHPAALPSLTMIFRPFALTGTLVSLLGFGGMRFGAIDNREVCVQLMVEAARPGLNARRRSC